MNPIRTQTGASFYMISLGSVIAVFFGIVGMKSVPIYLNQMAVSRAVAGAAADPAMAKAPIQQIRKRLQRQWDIEDISRLKPSDVKLIRAKDGRRKLKYEYEAREHLFLNVSMIHAFSDEVVMGGVD